SLFPADTEHTQTSGRQATTGMLTNNNDSKPHGSKNGVHRLVVVQHKHTARYLRMHWFI
ncbi:hypothetical protein KUCAC02_024865, partial [Chaenocephalus aceratus]